MDALMVLFIYVDMPLRSRSRHGLLVRLNGRAFRKQYLNSQHCNHFKTHNLEVLLRLSGTESKIKSRLFSDWSVVSHWNPASRYRKIGTATKHDAIKMIAAATNLLREL